MLTNNGTSTDGAVDGIPRRGEEETGDACVAPTRGGERLGVILMFSYGNFLSALPYSESGLDHSHLRH